MVNSGAEFCSTDVTPAGALGPLAGAPLTGVSPQGLASLGTRLLGARSAEKVCAGAEWVHRAVASAVLVSAGLYFTAVGT